MNNFTKIVLHWTAGKYEPNSTDLEHYHFLFDNEGKEYKGKYKPEDNLDCSDGVYAHHTGGGNTGGIGISLCGMFGYKSPQSVGNYPITEKQFEAACKKMAELCKKYNIPIKDTNVFTHKEFGDKHIETSSYGKIDINYLPFKPEKKPNEIGNYMRSKVKWYYEKL